MGFAPQLKRDPLGGIVLSIFSGPAGILTFLVLAVAALFVLALAFMGIAAAKAEDTLQPNNYARRRLRRWTVVAISSAALSVAAGAMAVANYLSCVGEC